MNIYTTEKIRNVVLLGHGGCGKTSLAEAMAYLAGLTSRMGKVDDGNTISDFGKEELKRHTSVSTSVIPLEWNGCKINLLILSAKWKKQSVLRMRQLLCYPVKQGWKSARKRHGNFARKIICPECFL